MANANNDLEKSLWAAADQKFTQAKKEFADKATLGRRKIGPTDYQAQVEGFLTGHGSVNLVILPHWAYMVDEPYFKGGGLNGGTIY